MTQQWFTVAARRLKRRAEQVAVQRVDLERQRLKIRARIAQKPRDWRGRWCR